MMNSFGFAGIGEFSELKWVLMLLDACVKSSKCIKQREGEQFQVGR